MRVERWDWEKANEMVASESYKRVLKAAEVIKAAVERECPEGSITRPMYKSGPYAGQNWTSADAGRLKKTIRVTEKDTEKWGYVFGEFSTAPGLVRIYAGDYLAWYAKIVEYSNPFMRRAIAASKAEVKDILENG